MIDSIQEPITAYYENKILQYGATSKGVDWNGEDSQELRFKQLLKIVTSNEGSILDFGCGYGAMYPYLKKNGLDRMEYVGLDVSSSMRTEAEKLFGKDSGFSVIEKFEATNRYDYAVASGLFNVNLHVGNKEWKKHCLDLISCLDIGSTKGFSFNMLTKYSDAEVMKDYLYYSDPLFFFDYCKKKYSKNVALLHDYGLYEFTILVRK
jgi:hypothetical protein